MLLPVITRVVRAAVQGTLGNGQPWVNVLHYRVAADFWGPTNIGNLDAEISKLYSAAGYGAGKEGWANNASTGARVSQVTYTPLDGSAASDARSKAIVGISAADSLPPRTAMVFTLRTALRGRSRRGRCYWAGFTETAGAPDGTPVDSVITAFNAAWAQHKTDLGAKTTPIALVVASYKLSDATDTTIVQGQDRWATQRRRG